MRLPAAAGLPGSLAPGAEEAGGACAEPDNPAGRPGGRAGGARRERGFGGGEGRGERRPGTQADWEGDGRLQSSNSS